MIAGDAVAKRRQPLLAWAVLVLFFIGLLAAGGFLVATQLQGSAVDKVQFVLEVLGLYAIGLGFVQRSAQLKSWSAVRDMTSSNLAEFMRSNLLVLTLPLNVAAVGLNPERLPGKARAQSVGLLGTVLLLACAPAILAYTLFHLVVIMPVAYIAYAMSGAIVASITGSAADVRLVETRPDGREEISVKQVIGADSTAFKSFLVGIPSTALSFVLELGKQLGVG